MASLPPRDEDQDPWVVARTARVVGFVVPAVVSAFLVCAVYKLGSRP